MPLMELDVQGALRPIAFAEGGNPHGVFEVGSFEERMTFREEVSADAWPSSDRTPEGHPSPLDLYYPWQLLYLDDVLDRPTVTLGLATLQSWTEERTAAFDRVVDLLQAQSAEWQALDAAWRPLMKILVRLQNRYLPEITGRSRMLYDAAQGQHVDVWQAEVDGFDADAVATELGVSAEKLVEAYWFLTERGIDREPRDGLELLRRARPRATHRRVHGSPRRAQDHFDAAEVLRRFITELTGRAPDRPRLWPADGRQPERAVLYERGPAGPTSRLQLRDELVDAGLYPHAVHLVGEGDSEKVMVCRLVEGLLGRQYADEIGFTDLGGSGSASRLNTMVGGFTTYAQRTVVIVDSEGDMASYVAGLTRGGELPDEDVLLFEANLEESNFTAAEMLEVLVRRAAASSDGLPAVDLDLPLDTVLAEYGKPRGSGRDEPGLAGTMLKLAEHPQYGGPFRISKPAFAQALADRMLTDLAEVSDDEEGLHLLAERRPLLGFVLERVVPVFGGRRRP
jgi:hypothetical protein